MASVAGAGKTEGLESAKKTRVTSHPSVEGKVREAGWEYVDDRVVVDERVITSRGPGTAMEFALAIVGELGSGEIVEQLAGSMVCKT